MDIDLTSVKLAVLVADGFELDEVTGPKEFLHGAGATAMIVSPENDRVRAGSDVSDEDLPVDVSLGSADESGFDALLLPGGEKSVERLAGNEAALAIIRAFLTGDRPIGAISQSLQLLIRADGVSGRRVTGDASLRDQLTEAGAEWVDKPVVVDRHLVTSSGKGSLQAFSQAFAQVCGEDKSGTGASLHTD
ncbi:MAG: DJ-1/PfpI family protein [Verrucomicrobia bacterium]|nr:DJ-1/PfpI family protein [Verrucomicrobiota bacterium]